MSGWRRRYLRLWRRIAARVFVRRWEWRRLFVVTALGSHRQSGPVVALGARHLSQYLPALVYRHYALGRWRWHFHLRSVLRHVLDQHPRLARLEPVSI